MGTVQNEVVELKVYRKSNSKKMDKFIDEAIDQLINNYLKRKQLSRGYLVIVDQKTDISLPDRIYQVVRTVHSHTVFIYFM
jgi:hypothetical protein